MLLACYFRSKVKCQGHEVGHAKLSHKMAFISIVKVTEVHIWYDIENKRGSYTLLKDNLLIIRIRIKM